MTGWAGRDPRAKLVLALVLSLALAFAPTRRVLPVLPVAVLLVASAGLDRRRLAALGRAVLLLWGLSLAANALFMPGPRLGPEVLGPLRPSVSGLAMGVEQGARLAVLAAVAAWAAATLGALELAGSLEWTLRRWPRLRRRAHRSLFPAVLSLRILPLVLREAQRLLDVDRLRGGRRRGREGLKRVAALAPLWLVSVVERADDLALALTLRGYRDGGERTFARRYRMAPLDWGLVAAGLGAAIYLGRP